MSDLISIIVPIYNVEKYLDRCMKTLQEQTYKNIEIILVDDGSPDNCPAMCDKYAQEDSRIKVVHKENAGLGFARNSGLEVATGKYIAFVDSDDYVTGDMCEKLYEAAIKNDADVVYGGIYYTEGTEITRESKVEKQQVWKDGKEFLLEMIGTEPAAANDTIIEVSVWKALFKKELFDKHYIRFVSERQFISEDVIFDIDYLSKANNIVVIPNCVYYYVNNPQSLSKNFRTDRFDKDKVLYDEIKRRLSRIYSEEVINRRTDRFLIARARFDMKQIVHHKSVIGEVATCKAVERICKDQDLVNILKRYPINKMPLKYALAAYLMKFKLYGLLEKILAR